jgi:hypothetical protein
MAETIPQIGSYTTLTPLDSDWNLGEDGSNVSMTDSNGTVYNLGKVINFHFTPKHEDVTIKPINYGGRELTQTERPGGTGTITAARQDGTMEALEYLQQQLKRAKKRELFFTIYQYIDNPGGTQNENMFVNCRVRLTDPGSYEMGKAVEQKIDFTYEDFVQVV